VRDPALSRLAVGPFAPNYARIIMATRDAKQVTLRLLSRLSAQFFLNLDNQAESSFRSRARMGVRYGIN